VNSTKGIYIPVLLKSQVTLPAVLAEALRGSGVVRSIHFISISPEISQQEKGRYTLVKKKVLP